MRNGEWTADTREEAERIFDQAIKDEKGLLEMYDSDGAILRVYPDIPCTMSYIGRCHANGRYGLYISIPSQVVHEMMLDIGDDVKITVERQ